MNNEQLDEEKSREVRSYIRKNELSQLKKFLKNEKITFNDMVGAIQEQNFAAFQYLYERYSKEEIILIKKETDIHLLKHTILHHNDEVFKYLTTHIDINQAKGLYWSIIFSNEEYLEQLLLQGAQIEHDNHAILKSLLKEINSILDDVRIATAYQIYVRERKEDIAWSIIEENLTKKNHPHYNIENTKIMIGKLHQRIKEIREKEELNESLKKELPITSDVAKSKL